MPPNKNVFELTTATEVQERLDETVVQLKDQDDDWHEDMNGDAGDEFRDFATNSEIFTVSANSEMVKNVSNESEDKDYETEQGHPVDRVEQSFATASQKILTFSANANLVESVTIESDMTTYLLSMIQKTQFLCKAKFQKIINVYRCLLLLE